MEPKCSESETSRIELRQMNFTFSMISPHPFGVRKKNNDDNKPMSSIFIEFLAPTVTVPLNKFFDLLCHNNGLTRNS